MAEPSVPDCLTIDEARRVMRLSKTTAYEQARVFRETGGKAGLPNFEMGGLRVPTAALENLLGRPITHIPEPTRAGPKGADVELEEERSDADVRQLHPRRGRSGGAVGEQDARPQ
jgi:hypothetical protein